MKNWNTLRPLLREKFGKDFYFFNDVRTKDRRIKLMGLNDKFDELVKMGVDVKMYDWSYGSGVKVIKCVVIICDK